MAQTSHGIWRPISSGSEALICRITAATAVLRLPSEEQLGYRGNVINFLNDLATVSKQLPRAPKDCGIIIYRTPSGSNKDKASEARHTRLERVRREAIDKHLRFFATHHKVYREGIRNPSSSSGADDEYLVPPFRYPEDIDFAVLNKLPKNGVPEGLVIRDLQPGTEDGTGASGEGDEDKEVEEHTVHSKKKVNDALLTLWLRTGHGPFGAGDEASC